MQFDFNFPNILLINERMPQLKKIQYTQFFIRNKIFKSLQQPKLLMIGNLIGHRIASLIYVSFSSIYTSVNSLKETHAIDVDNGRLPHYKTAVRVIYEGATLWIVGARTYRESRAWICISRVGQSAPFCHGFSCCLFFGLATRGNVISEKRDKISVVRDDADSLFALLKTFACMFGAFYV